VRRARPGRADVETHAAMPSCPSGQDGEVNDGTTMNLLRILGRLPSGVASRCARICSVCRERLGRRLGIGAHLGIALAAAAALVLAVNLLVEKVVFIETTTQVTRTVSIPTPVAALARPAPAPPAADTSEPRQAPSSGTEIPDRLLLTLGDFDEAVRARLATDGEPSRADYQRTRAEMNAALNTLAGSGASVGGKSYPKLAAAFSLHQREADALVFTSDAQRALSVKYFALIETLNARDKQSLDHS
jgi:hypothetical protein